MITELCKSWLLILLIGSFVGCTSGEPKTDSEIPRKGEAQKGEAEEAAVKSENAASIYQFGTSWQNQDGDSVKLADFKGKIAVMAMTFTNCEFACPMILADLKATEKALPASVRDEVVFVLASFDTERDTPQRLAEYAEQMKLGSNWVLLHGSESQVRTLSMLLNVKYKKQEDGNFAHSNIITVLNQQGEIAQRTEGLNVDIKPIVAKITELSND